LHACQRSAVLSDQKDSNGGNASENLASHGVAPCCTALAL
jgi:hypothetical protein